MSASPDEFERARLATLRSYGILETAREPDFDDIVKLAAQICGTPIALISIVDAHRQWFKAACGMSIEETARDIAFCDHAIRQRGTFSVPDATRDPRFAANPLVTDAPHIRFYAGAPLLASDGHALGTLCVIDHEPRRLTDAQDQALSVLSRHVMAQFEVRRQTQERQRVNRALLSLLEDERLAQSATRESHALNGAILDSMLSQIAVIDRDGRIIAVNEAWRRFGEEASPAQRGFQSNRDIGMNYLQVCRSGMADNDEYAARAYHGLKSLLGGESGSFTLEYPCDTPEGRRWVLMSASPLRVASGGAAISHLDITERRRLEEQLRQSHRLEAVGQLTGGVAHDFNNLLTVILGNGELICEELGPSAPLRASAAMIVDAARSAAELTKRLLAFARKQALQPSAIDPNRLITEMHPLLRRTLGAHIDIKLAFNGGTWQALVDGAQLENALLNLCINARDAMSGGGRLLIETANLRLDQAGLARQFDVPAGDYVAIVVTDTGCGIPAEILGRVFEPFFTTKDRSGGTGLGLAMVYGFIKQSGGHINILSEPGHGTIVTMYLPRAVDSALTASPTTAPAAPLRGTETLLLVEDNEAVRDFARRHLESLGYRVLQAASGVEALEILAGPGHIDLLFTDVVMPGGIGGAGLAEAARTRRPGLKVLLTSGYSEDAIIHQGRLDPGIQLLSKPYRGAELALRVRDVLDAP
ncbi:MAG: response regulator [Gammaproteobacteria bacterium]|nr:response regulator [Gammaproteobacteria bacterium]